MTKEQMEIINKLVWFIPFTSLRNATRNLLISLFNHIEINSRTEQDENLLIYMKNVNNLTVNYLFSIKKELAELKGNSKGKNNKVIYTCITNRYDNLFVHTYINNDWDYICFTDDKNLIDSKIYGNWIIKPLCNYVRGGG